MELRSRATDPALDALCFLNVRRSVAVSLRTIQHPRVNSGTGFGLWNVAKDTVMMGNSTRNGFRGGGLS